MNKTLLIGNESQLVRLFLENRSLQVNYSFSAQLLCLLFEQPRVSNIFLENTNEIRNFCEVAWDITNIRSIIIDYSLINSLPHNVKNNLSIYLSLFPEYTSIYIVMSDLPHNDTFREFITRKFFIVQEHNLGAMNLFGKDNIYNKQDIVILGSCVARDSMEINNEISPLKLNVLEYIGRNSIASLDSKPVEYPAGLESLPSAFLTKCITYDLQKKTTEHLVSALTKDRILLLDFMDERFDLIETKNSFITNSWDYRETVLCKTYIVPDLTHKFYSQFKLDLWKANFTRLLEKIGKVASLQNIIIFAPPMTRIFYREKDVVAFDELKYKTNEYNEMLDCMKFYIECNHPDIKLIEPLPWMMFCDYRHKWGGHPYHYNNYLYMYFSGIVKRHKAV